MQISETGSLLWPLALAMIELARVPLALAVRTQSSWKVKLSALVGVASAVAVTSTSLSNIGNLTFNPRLEDAQQKRSQLIDARQQRDGYLAQITSEENLLAQRIRDRDQIAETYQKLATQLNAQAPQTCSVLTNKNEVKVDEGAIVKLDPRSSVRVVGDLKFDMPQPSKERLQLDTMTRSAELPFTNYTIFKSVDYGGGEVVTGWNFDLSDTARPKSQLCYYNQHVEKGLGIRQTIAINRTPLPPVTPAKTKFDFDAALSNCIWFSGA